MATDKQLHRMQEFLIDRIEAAQKYKLVGDPTPRGVLFENKDNEMDLVLILTHYGKGTFADTRQIVARSRHIPIQTGHVLLLDGKAAGVKDLDEKRTFAQSRSSLRLYDNALDIARNKWVLRSLEKYVLQRHQGSPVTYYHPGDETHHEALLFYTFKRLELDYGYQREGEHRGVGKATNGGSRSWRLPQLQKAALQGHQVAVGTGKDIAVLRPLQYAKSNVIEPKPAYTTAAQMDLGDILGGSKFGRAPPQHFGR